MRAPGDKQAREEENQEPLASHQGRKCQALVPRADDLERAAQTCSFQFRRARSSALARAVAVTLSLETENGARRKPYQAFLLTVSVRRRARPR
eukprot:5744967-Pyramimonas_sp.AAC.1